MRKLILSTLLILSQSLSCMELNSVWLPDDIIGEFISQAAQAEANEAREKINQELKKRQIDAQKKAQKQFDENKETLRYRPHIPIPTDTTHYSLGNRTFGEEKTDSHLRFFCKQLTTCRCVCKKWHQLIDTIFNTYLYEHEQKLTQILRAYILETDASWTDEAIEKKYKKISTLLNALSTLYTFDLHTQIDCADYELIVLHHPHCSPDIIPNFLRVHLSLGGRINEPTPWTLLHYAAHASNPKTIQLFLSKECINAQDNAGATPLHIAASTQLENLDDDLENGVLVESIATRIIKSHLASVQLLLEHGADPHIQDIKGKKPIDYARSKKIKKLFRKYM